MNQQRAISVSCWQTFHFKVHGKTEAIASVLTKHKELIEYMENVDNLGSPTPSTLTTPGTL